MSKKHCLAAGAIILGVGLTIWLGAWLITGSDSNVLNDSVNPSIKTKSPKDQPSHPSSSDQIQGERIAINPISPGETASEAPERASILFQIMISEIRSLTEEELAREFGNCEFEDFKKSSFSNRFNQIEKIHYNKCVEKRKTMQKAALEEKKKALRDQGIEFEGDVELSKQEKNDCWFKARKEVALEGDDLPKVFCSALSVESRNRIRAFLVYECGFCTHDNYLFEPLWQVLLSVIQEEDPYTERHLIFPLARIMSYYKHDPYPLWATVVDSEKERLIRDMYLYLYFFPSEQVEELLFKGIQDERYNIRFGAMEAVRFLGTKGKIDVDRFSAKLAEIVELYPELSLYFIEAIGALGRAVPYLADLVWKTDQDKIRLHAAMALVLSTTPEVALAHITSWLDKDGKIREAGIQALGILPGSEAKRMLDHLFDNAENAETMQAVLKAMGGRNEDFTHCFLKALRDKDNELVRLEGIRGLLLDNLKGDGALGVGEEKVLNEIIQDAVARDSSSEVRGLSVMAMGLRQGLQAKEALKESFLSDGDAEVRGIAGLSLLLLSRKDPELAPWVEESINSEGNSLVRGFLNDYRDRIESEESRAGMIDEMEQNLKISNMAAPFVEEKSAKNMHEIQSAYLKKMIDMLKSE